MAFNLPINLSRLQNGRMRLVPFEDDRERYAAAYVADATLNPYVLDYLPYGPSLTADEFMSYIEEHTNEKVFAILLRAGIISRKDPSTGQLTTIEVNDGTFAGVSSLFNSEPEHASVEIGHSLISTFSRTFVGTQSNALLLHFLLDSPELGGLGLRRVQWLTNVDNAPSVKAARRLGFREEGVMRWARVLPEHKIASDGAGLDAEGLPVKAVNGGKWGPGRHTVIFALCWDDWENGGRERIDGLVERYSQKQHVVT